MMYYGNGNGWIFDWGWILMTATMVALLGVLIAMGMVLYQHSTRAGTLAPTPIRTDEPSRILAERFARGEIDETEYLDRLRRLREHDQI